MKTKPENSLLSANENQTVAHKQQDRQLSVEHSASGSVQNTFPSALPLTGLDLIQQESLLCASLRKFLSFKTYTLHFPVLAAHENPNLEAEILPHERKILLPLKETNGSLLGVFVAKDVNLTNLKKLLPWLPKIGELCLENLSLYKQSLRDKISGLFTREHLLNIFSGSLEHMREYLRPENPKHGPVRISLLVLRLNGFAELIHDHGYLRAERFLTCLALELELLKPQQLVAARSGDYEFSLLLPALSAGECRELGQKLAVELSAVRLKNEISGQYMQVSVSAGYITFPTDLNGIERHTPAEQARRLLRRARLAAVMAQENLLTGKYRELYAQADPPAPILAYGNILAEGGRVTQTLPLSRLLLNLGKNVGARPGQRFTLWGYALKNEPAAKIIRRYKGELVLVEVRPNDSTAELVYCDDPYFPPEVGDQVLLNTTSDDFTEQESIPREARLDEATKFLSYPDFLTRWSVERRKYDNFALILTRFGLPNQNFLLDPANPDGEEEVTALRTTPYANNQYIPWEEQMAACADLYRSALNSGNLPDSTERSCLYGRYGLNSFIIFVPNIDLAALPAFLEKAEYLSTSAALDKNIALQSALGLALHPFLDFHKGDALENAHKALEYALLLPAPHVGLLDSLALNISADRRYSLGDQLGAISEYKRALLCDENNILAWNSLGVTLAALGHQAEARHHFEEALKRNAQSSTTLYNLGQLSESSGEHDEARGFFLRCRELSPDNVYVLYRLGRLSEQSGNNSAAADYYKQAASLPGGAAITRRAMARLAIKENRLEDAREELHEALLINPNDAAALQLLAKLYLDAGENPLVAESLTRQSVALRPDFKAAWLELARALEATGKRHEAREAIIKAGEL